RAGGEQRPRLRQFLLRQLQPALRGEALRLHLGQLLLALRELLAVDRERARQLADACLEEAPLVECDALLLVVARLRRDECAAFGQRAQTRGARAQREALRRALAHAGTGARLVDAQQ